MGASSWRYTVPYQADVQAALDELRATEFAERRYHLPDYVEEPGTIEELFADEGFYDYGTHSILDIQVAQAVGGEPVDDDFAVRPLDPDSIGDVFGSDRPTRAAFEEARERRCLPYYERWNGYHTVLFDEAGTPAEIAFWGYSGD